MSSSFLDSDQVARGAGCKVMTFVSQAHHAIVVDVRVQVGSQSVTSAPPQRKVARQRPYQRQRSERSASALAHGCESDLPRHLHCEHLTVLSE